MTVVSSRLLVGDRLTLMSARLGWLVGALGSPECPVHIHLPLSNRSPPLPLRNLHYSSNSLLPAPPCQKANCEANPLLFLSPLLVMGTLQMVVLIVFGGSKDNQGRSYERRALLTPAGLHPCSIATLPPPDNTSQTSTTIPRGELRSLCPA